MKYQLMVSYNAGNSYEIDSEADDPDELSARTDELDKAGWRWFIDGEEPVSRKSAVHMNIINTLSTLCGGDRHGG